MEKKANGGVKLPVVETNIAMITKVPLSGEVRSVVSIWTILFEWIMTINILGITWAVLFQESYNILSFTFVSTLKLFFNSRISLLSWESGSFINRTEFEMKSIPV